MSRLKDIVTLSESDTALARELNARIWRDGGIDTSAFAKRRGFISYPEEVGWTGGLVQRQAVLVECSETDDVDEGTQYIALQVTANTLGGNLTSVLYNLKHWELVVSPDGQYPPIYQLVEESIRIGAGGNCAGYFRRVSAPGQLIGRDETDVAKIPAFLTQLERHIPGPGNLATDRQG